MNKLGPGMWYTMHMYPLCLDISKRENSKDAMMEMFTFVQDVIPCEACRIHMKEFAVLNSIYSDISSSNWINALHGTVSSRLGKQVFTEIKSCQWYTRLITCALDPEEQNAMARQVWPGMAFLISSALLSLDSSSSSARRDHIMTILMPGVPPMKGGGVPHWVSCLGEGECPIGCHAWAGFHRRGSAPLGVMPGVPPMKGGGVPHWGSCLGEGECPIGCHAWGSTGGGVRHWVSCLGFHP